MIYLKLKSLCKEKGITFREVEDKAGLGSGCISRWKDDKVKPNMETLKKIAVVIDVPLTELFKDQ